MASEVLTASESGDQVTITAATGKTLGDYRHLELAFNFTPPMFSGTTVRGLVRLPVQAFARFGDRYAPAYLLDNRSESRTITNNDGVSQRSFTLAAPTSATVTRQEGPINIVRVQSNSISLSRALSRGSEDSVRINNFRVEVRNRGHIIFAPFPGSSRQISYIEAGSQRYEIRNTFPSDSRGSYGANGATINPFPGMGVSSVRVQLSWSWPRESDSGTNANDISVTFVSSGSVVYTRAARPPTTSTVITTDKAVAQWELVNPITLNSTSMAIELRSIDNNRRLGVASPAARGVF